MKPLIKPDWPLPDNVGAICTTRLGGVSQEPWSTFNLGLHVEDNPAHVHHNRQRLLQAIMPADSQHDYQLQWLNQVHGTDISLAVEGVPLADADACISRTPGLVAVVMTADCLPVLLCDKAGTVVAAVHAGWRSLASGVLRKTVEKMAIDTRLLSAYLGPAISQQHFEVGAEVRQAFLSRALSAEHKLKIPQYFQPGKTASEKLYADLYGLAQAELNTLGVTSIYGGDFCTYAQPKLFFSFRRDGQTGRMASLIWLK